MPQGTLHAVGRVLTTQQARHLARGAGLCSSCQCRSYAARVSKNGHAGSLSEARRGGDRIPARHLTRAGVDIKRRVRDDPRMNTQTITAAALEHTFQTLAAEWREATRFAAAPSAAAEHPAYRAVIDLGPDVVPLILAALADTPEPWFAALRELTGADPVPLADRGRPAVAADHWLAWGRARGLV